MNAATVRGLLRDAQSMVPESIRSAEASLRVAETQPGFGYLLAQLVSVQDLPESDRQLSAILLKKFVRAHWDAEAESFEVSSCCNQLL